MYTRAPQLWSRAPEAIAMKHAQLGELLEAAPAEVRSFAMQQPTILCRDITSDAFVKLVRLWVDEVNRPLSSILAAPNFLSYNIKRSAARIAFMRERGHVMTPSAAELCTVHCVFCQRLGSSEAEFEDWHQEWLKSPMGLRYGS